MGSTSHRRRILLRTPSEAGEIMPPANTLGIRRIAFAVDDIDAAVAGLRARGAELVGGVERYEDSYRLCYVGGPEGSSSCLRSRSAEGSGQSPNHLASVSCRPGPGSGDRSPRISPRKWHGWHDSHRPEYERSRDAA